MKLTELRILIVEDDTEAPLVVKDKYMAPDIEVPLKRLMDIDMLVWNHHGITQAISGNMLSEAIVNNSFYGGLESKVKNKDTVPFKWSDTVSLAAAIKHSLEQ